MYDVIIIVAVVILAIIGVAVKYHIIKRRKRAMEKPQSTLYFLGMIIHSMRSS